jgi:outer membrane protein assembly factor BamE (lipoprotein component of BamABCDE complex)
MNLKHPRNFISLVLSLGLLACAGLTGCSVDMSSHTETTGTYIGPQTLQQIQAGKTKDFVTALLGEPTKKDKASDTDEIWRWVYVEKHVANGSAALLTGTASNTENTHTTFVEFKNNVVDHAWSQ